MGRLIDADRLKDELITLPMMSNWGEAFIPSLINKQPTAYDIDKVVGCLEKASCYIEDGCGHARHLVFTDEAIEIVKKGGAE